jgi:hypothetical protein
VSLDFAKLLLVLIGIAVALGLVIAAFVFMGGKKDTKRYRPGRPFTFAPVWFLSAPERQSRAGILGEAPAGPPTGRVARPRETGGASDRW